MVKEYERMSFPEFPLDWLAKQGIISPPEVFPEVDRFLRFMSKGRDVQLGEIEDWSQVPPEERWGSWKGNTLEGLPVLRCRDVLAEGELIGVLTYSKLKDREFVLRYEGKLTQIPSSFSGDERNRRIPTLQEINLTYSYDDWRRHDGWNDVPFP